MTERKHFLTVPSSYVILERDGEIALLRRHNTGYRDGEYCVPAGHVEQGELALTGAIREAKEESGIDLKPKQLRLVHVMHRRCGDHERVDFFFLATEWEGDPINAEPHRADELRWAPVDNLPSNMAPYIAAAITHYRADRMYSEFDEENNKVLNGA